MTDSQYIRIRKGRLKRKRGLDGDMFIRCLFCKRENCETHLCHDCWDYKVVPIYHKVEQDYSFCDCGNHQLLYQTRCGMIYDGNAQCSCEICFLGSGAEESDESESSEENTYDPED